jgi:hypothetical protein
MSGLPKLDLPRYKHKLVGLNKEVKYRGFTTKEQKILLGAKEEDSADQMLEAIKQIIENCTFGDIDVDTLPYFDLEDLFLRIREKSVSDVVELAYNVKDKDGAHLEQIHLSVDLKEVKVKTNPDHKDKIQLSDQIGIKMKYPTVDMLKHVGDEMAMLESCIDCIFTEDEVFYVKDYSREDYEEFIDSLDVAALKKIKTFFDTMPRLRHEETINLKDGTTETIKFEGLQDFF